MKVMTRVLMSAVVSVAALFAGAATSHAGMDNELSVVDGQGRTLTIQQWDTFLNGVFPLDRNRLTREGFHSGKAPDLVAGEAVPLLTGAALPTGVLTGAAGAPLMLWLLLRQGRTPGGVRSA